MLREFGEFSKKKKKKGFDLQTFLIYYSICVCVVFIILGGKMFAKRKMNICNKKIYNFTLKEKSEGEKGMRLYKKKKK